MEVDRSSVEFARKRDNDYVALKRSTEQRSKELEMRQEELAQQADAKVREARSALRKAADLKKQLKQLTARVCAMCRTNLLLLDCGAFAEAAEAADGPFVRD